ARNVASTTSGPASQPIVSGVGRVFPRSICEMYSFEKRSPARSVCVTPADARWVGTRSPRREPLGGADVPLLVVDAVTTRSSVAERLQFRNPPIETGPPKVHWVRQNTL